MSLRRAVCTSDNIATAFLRYAKLRGLWAPGIPMPAVAAAPAHAILKLAEELREGRYRPHPPKIIPIAKANGGQRQISIYMMRDRVAQRALLQAAQRRSDWAMSPLSFGYRPGRGVTSALACLRSHLEMGYEWVVDADIERCFDSIPRGPLLEDVNLRLGESAASSLVAQYLGWNRSERRLGVGIPQGSGLAPWLCNIYLWRLDERMQASRIPILRYADDFVLLTRTREEAHRALSLCAATLQTMRLKLQPLKTRIVERLSPFRFLGSLITPHLHPASA